MSLRQEPSNLLNTSDAPSTGIYPINSTAPPQVENGDRTTFDIIKIFFYFAILVSSTFGNGMVAYIICSTRKMRNASNYLILNLAICDFLTPVISIPFDFALEENGYVWPYGGFMCRIFYPAATLTATSSALCLAVISLDRYRIIMHPYKPRLTPRQIAIAIISTHIFSIACVIPYSYVLRLKHGSCDEEWGAFKYRQGYTAFLFVVQYALPLPFMVIMYTLALLQLYQSYGRTFHMRSTREGSSDDTRETQNGTAKVPWRQGRRFTNDRRNSHSRTPKRTSNANVRATKMFIVVVAVFAVFMLPNQVVWMWADFGAGVASPHLSKIQIICWLFTYTNCVCNPIIFAVFSKDVRNGFSRVFGGPSRRLRTFSRSTLSTLDMSTWRSGRATAENGNDIHKGTAENGNDPQSGHENLSNTPRVTDGSSENNEAFVIAQDIAVSIETNESSKNATFANSGYCSEV